MIDPKVDHEAAKAATGLITAAIARDEQLLLASIHNAAEVNGVALMRALIAFAAEMTDQYADAIGVPVEEVLQTLAKSLHQTGPDSQD